jgi:DNA-binding GntR family transcriptional regulator
MLLEKIATKTIRQEVYDRLKDKIISAEFLPGETVTLRDLAEKFNVSHMPVREALWQLESEKIIVIERNRKIRVNKLTVKQLDETLRLRIMLESSAMERACERRPDQAVPEVKKLLEAMWSAVEKRPKIYLRKNTEFHFAIYSYADSPLLLEIIESLFARVHPYIYLHAVKKRDLGYAKQCHQEMLEAFDKRDKERITEALSRDLKAAAETIIPFLENDQ